MVYKSAYLNFVFQPNDTVHMSRVMLDIEVGHLHGSLDTGKLLYTDGWSFGLKKHKKNC